VTGRKLACDTYGGIGRIGGGALSGKDPSKVDRSAAYMARKIARDIVLAGYASKCEVQLAYAIGMVEPVSVAVDCFGTGYMSNEEVGDYIRGSYDLTPKGIVKQLGLLDVDYNKVSDYGHFGKENLPWEQISGV
jgi:S-adenosylmethionine synthetase